MLTPLAHPTLEFCHIQPDSGITLDAYSLTRCIKPLLAAKDLADGGQDVRCGRAPARRWLRQHLSDVCLICDHQIDEHREGLPAPCLDFHITVWLPAFCAKTVLTEFQKPTNL